MALPRIDFGLSRDERLPTILLIVFFTTLCFAGGASREDVLAQGVIRGVAVIAILIQIIAGRLPDLRRYRACAWLLGAMAALVAVQLVPLPPALWAALPGRGLIAASPLGATGWRPLNLVPDAGWNSLFSLLVPLCALVLVSSLEEKTVRRVTYIVIGSVIFSALLALLQAAGILPDNPLINGSATEYSGVFANRNHQALFLSLGIVVTWHWGFGRGGDLRDRRLWLAICIVLLLSISILVTGSRSGIVMGAVAILAASLFTRPNRRGERKGGLRRILWPAISLGVLGGVLFLSNYFGRATSFDRASVMTVSDDFRLRALPTVWQVALTYFPFGAGLGSFDAVFRAAEPFGLLEPTYFNHAHNDFAETIIETGIFGPIILLAALAWFVRRICASFLGSGEAVRTARLGAALIALVLAAGVSDYAARTPMIMTVLVIAGCWLTETAAGRRSDRSEDALPTNAKFL